MSPLPTDLLPRLVTLCHEAGRAIMAVYAAGDPEVHEKADSSPVTAADLAADCIILQGLARHWPHRPVVSEETPCPQPEALSAAAGYFLVDPLDGTREFLARNGEFTVNIAWVVEGRAVAGVVHAPALGQTFWGARGSGAFRSGPGISAQPIFVRPQAQGNARWRVLGSRSHRGASTDAWLQALPAEVDFFAAGSSLKFCRLAEGEGDLYPRFGPTHHWDTAAGQAVLEAAGGVVLTAAGKPLRYPVAPQQSLNPHFVALACAGLWAGLPPFPA